VAPFSAGGSGRSRWADRIAGIVVGVVLGLGVLVYFVFAHSEGTIDAPKVNEGKAESSVPAHPRSPEVPAEEPAKKKPAKQAKPVPVVKVIGGAPPTGSGPKQLHFTKGEKVRFEIETSEPFSFEIKGLGITESIESSSTISFKAMKTGQFPVIATTTLIGVADLLIQPTR
jgi:hypothetical protein